MFDLDLSETVKDPELGMTEKPEMLLEVRDDEVRGLYWLFGYYCAVKSNQHVLQCSGCDALFAFVLNK